MIQIKSLSFFDKLVLVVHRAVTTPSLVWIYISLPRILKEQGKT